MSRTHQVRGHDETAAIVCYTVQMFQTVMEGRAWTGAGWAPSTQPRYPPAPPPERGEYGGLAEYG